MASGKGHWERQEDPEKVALRNRYSDLLTKLYEYQGDISLYHFSAENSRPTVEMSTVICAVSGDYADKYDEYRKKWIADGFALHQGAEATETSLATKISEIEEIRNGIDIYTNVWVED
ncbi:MAG: hypothetical protein K6G10_09580 [Butyrivibrio sp.]|nr:hypothetical protein [Butyrivibrio sp.]